MDIAGGTRPVDAYLALATLVEKGRLAVVLGRESGAAARQGVHRGQGQAGEQRQGALEDIGGGVLRADGDDFLEQDVAQVQFVFHAVHGDAGLGLAVGHGPVDRGEAAVARQ
ncbi:hypothetical protein D3C81_1427210 [compost metagenome]